MKYIFLALLSLSTLNFSLATHANEQAVQHKIVADITELETAKSVFNRTTAELKTKQELSATELHEIHMITYSLEKAVAYFVDTNQGQAQKDAEQLAGVVELVHIASENNRSAETRVYLDEYFKLADAFSTDW
ncbi:hypothetical protein GCM10008090_24400 [Arenicella chitinivorans]|uniref:Uncharacterized protein n=1 Tax=Arenicella chitinivorans TaxID=1329800 RepID=A0A918RYL1_9GAMM|nr:DUF6746 family protein [Arenicella chitinivorans]GHA13772.1 hypothetical protein GCM10008090_24400 [Arenicella chitinivorans]